MVASWSHHRRGGFALPTDQPQRRRLDQRAIKVLGVRVPKRAAVAALAASGLLALMGPDLDLDLARRLAYATTCIHNIYVDTVEDAVLMPSLPERDAAYIPSHIKMCYEWLRQDALNVDASKIQRLNVLEHEDVCLDWTAPHYSMLEIAASSALNTVLPRIRYRHGCPSHRRYDEQERGYDWSTIQSVFQEPAMAVDRDLVNVEQYKTLCKGCLAQYDAGADAARVRSRAFYHCFALPERSEGYVNPTVLSPVPSPTPISLPLKPDVLKSTAPISALVRPLKARIFHSAAEWVNVTDYPPQETNTGTVIVIDPNTLPPINPSAYNIFVPPTTSSISIIAGPLCYTATLLTGQNCAEYGNELREHFLRDFPNLDGNGFEGGPGVNFQISASTAGVNSRAVFANTLICPPRTPSCLLPAFGKHPPTEAKVLEVPCPDCPGAGLGAVPFFENVGADEPVEVIQLPDAVRPDVAPGSPDAPAPVPIPETPGDYPLSPAFGDAQKPITGDGYPDDGSPVPSPVDPAILALEPSSVAYKSVEPRFPPEVSLASTDDPTEASPLNAVDNVIPDHSNTERVPTEEEIQRAVDDEEPLDTNTPFNPPEEPEDEDERPDPTASTELATDENAGLAAPALSDERYIELAVARRNSKERIVTGYDGNFLFEVPCPSSDSTGHAVVVDDGYAVTDNGDTVIVSDGHGTVTFKSPVNITTVDVMEDPVTDEATGETRVVEYSTIVDPILDEPVNVTIENKVTNPRSTLEVTQPAGQLVVEPSTQRGCLITYAEMGNLKKTRDNNGKKTHTIIEGEVVSAGNENVPPSETGTVVMEDGSLAVTGKIDGFDGFLHTNPILGNTGRYQELMASPLEYQVQKVTVDRCQHQDFANPIYVAMPASTMVFFDVVQTFKGSDISWVAVGYKDMFYGGDYDCKKTNEVPPGMIKNSRAAAICEFKDGVWQTEVDIFIHDGSKKINQVVDAEFYGDPYDITPRIPPSCQASEDYGNKCHFKFRVSCQMGLPPPPGDRRLRKGFMTPDHVQLSPRHIDEQDRRTFARNILDRCPEAGEERVFDHYQFGGNAYDTNRIDIRHGAAKLSPGKIATAFTMPSMEAAA